MKDKGKTSLSSLLQKYYIDNTGNLKKEDIQLPDSPYYRLKHCRAGSKLVEAGSASTTVILVVIGEFYIKRSSSMGKPNVLAKTEAPEFIGQMQLITDDPYYYSDIYASKDSYYIEFEKQYFYNEVRNSVDCCWILLQSFAKVVYRNHYRMDRNAFHTTEDNLLHEIYLSYLSEDSRNDVYIFKDSKVHLADLLGVSERTVFRAIEKLKSAGTLDTNAQGHIVISREELINFSKKKI